MTNEIAIPVVVGLASGIALVAIFAVLVISSSDTSGSIPERHHSFQVSIDRIKNTYKTGERIDFIMRIKGYGNTCANPNLTIRNADTLEVVWYSKTVIWVCDTTPQLVNWGLDPEDLSAGRATLYISETGSYEYAATFADSHTVRGSFDVTGAK